VNHEANWGTRIKDALAQLGEIFVRLTALMDEEEPAPRAALAAPVAPPLQTSS
jgi:hypothetical protein